MTRVLLSYARGDDEPFVRRLYNDLTATGFSVWFDRESLLARGLGFHQEIKDAMLSESEQRRFAELAVFFTDRSIPQAAVDTLWAHTGQLDDLDTEDLLINLAERLGSGWTFGPERDPEKKKTPFLVSWKDLPDGVRKWDRDVVRRLPSLFQNVALVIYRLPRGQGR